MVASWELLGPSWRPLEATQVPLGSFLGIVGGILGPLGKLQGSSWRLLGGLLGSLERLLDFLETFSRWLGGFLGRSWELCWLLARPEGENVDSSVVLQWFGDPDDALGQRSNNRASRSRGGGHGGGMNPSPRSLNSRI